jgi:hypothetical protein
MQPTHDPISFFFFFFFVTRKTICVYPVHHTCGIQQSQLAGARPAAAHIGTSDRPTLGQHHGHARSGRFIGGIANGYAINIGDQVSRSGFDHARSRSKFPRWVN